MAKSRLANEQPHENIERLSPHLVRYDFNEGRYFVGTPTLPEYRYIMSMSPQLDSIQRFIITRHREFFDESPSPMKLQKLCYYAQGYLLAQGTELFEDDFQAWQHGPVVPALYHRYKDYSWRSISEDVAFDDGEITVDAAREVSEIVAAYGSYDGAALSTMTHREAPWMDARGNLPEDQASTALISKDAMRAYFAGKLAADVRV